MANELFLKIHRPIATSVVIFDIDLPSIIKYR